MNNLTNGEYWMYLRKSRADIEAEARGEGETLAKHRNALHKLAADRNLMVTRIYQETVSGESIIHRPEMVKLLQDLEAAPPAGVLVMDIDRLGRGDKIDQGIIERAFKESNTLIITPTETYDMNNEAGEFGVEVRSFLARMELKQITKRMQGGRIRSVENGNYIGTRAPYGYEITKDAVGRTLKPHPIQSEVVRLVFNWYTHDNLEQRIGTRKIASKLQEMKFPTYSGKPWDASVVLSILKNEVYCGVVQWKKKESKRSKTPGKRRDTRTRDRSEWIQAQGRHEPLVSRELFDKAQEILQKKYHVPYQLHNGVTNPLAGLIRCGKCGSSMVQRPQANTDNQIMCIKSGCTTKSSKAYLIEEQLFSSLRGWLENYKEMQNYELPSDESESNVHLLIESQINDMHKKLEQLQIQKRRIHELLEQGVYDTETFLNRNKEILESINGTELALEELTKQEKLELQRQEAQLKVIPKIESAIQSYENSDDPTDKNLILKSVIDYCIYNKEKWQRNDQFELFVLPKLPQ